MTDKIYLVTYCGGSYDDWFETEIFATTVKSRATKYRAKFNRMLKKWKEHYSQYEEVKCNMPWIKDDCHQYYHRWSSLQNISGCDVKQIELR